MNHAFCIFCFVLSLFLLGCQSDVPVTAIAERPTEIIPTPSQTPQPTSIPATSQPVETPTRLPATAVPLTLEQEKANLFALAQLYGLVRYFHPSDQVANVEDWGAFVMSGVAVVRDARTEEELAQRLEQIFDPLAPTMQILIGESDTVNDLFSEAINQADELIMWEHYGVRADNRYRLYTSERITTPVDAPDELFHDPTRPYTQMLGPNLTVSLPLVLYVDEGQTVPLVSEMPLGDVDEVSTTETEYLASAIMFWAITQHFYPYFDVVNVDWAASLDEALQAILLDELESDWERALQKLVANLEDGHGRLTNLEDGFPEIYSPFISLGWVEEQLVVTGSYGYAQRLVEVGDRVVKIGADTAVERLEQEMALISAATQAHKRTAAIRNVLLGQQYTAVLLTVEHADGTQEDLLFDHDTIATDIPPSYRPASFTEVAPNIFYIDLSKVEPAGFEAKLMALEGVDGLIFDLRGYSAVLFDFLELLITEPITSAQFLVPQTITPNQERVTYDDGAWSLEPQVESPLSENIIFLTNSDAISRSETTLAMVAHYQIGEIVGEPTAGTNGNVNQIKLPSGHLAVWTGMLVLNQDGSQHHGVGVQPTVPVLQTIEDLQNQIDTQLEAAIELILEKE